MIEAVIFGLGNDDYESSYMYIINKLQIFRYDMIIE